MFENNRKETANKAAKSIRHQNETEKSTWITHRYFVDFENESTLKFPRRIAVIISTWIWLSKSMKSQRTFTWNFDVESMVNRRRSAHWVRTYICENGKYLKHCWWFKNCVWWNYGYCCINKWHKYKIRKCYNYCAKKFWW